MFICKHVSGACQSHSRPVLNLCEASWKYVELSPSTPPFLTLQFYKKDLTPTPNLLRISGQYSLRLGIFDTPFAQAYLFNPAVYVGVNIKKLKDGSYEFTQRALIDSIIDDIGLKDAKVKPVPAKVSLQLHAFKDVPAFDLNFNYRSTVGKLNYLAQTTRPDIMYATHQTAKYLSDSRESHGDDTLIFYSIDTSKTDCFFKYLLDIN
jgi:hypothetical protein